MNDHIETRAFYSREAEGNPNEREAAASRPEIGRVEQCTGRHGPWAVVFDRSKQAA